MERNTTTTCFFPKFELWIWLRHKLPDLKYVRCALRSIATGCRSIPNLLLTLTILTMTTSHYPATPSCWSCWIPGGKAAAAGHDGWSRTWPLTLAGWCHDIDMSLSWFLHVTGVMTTNMTFYHCLVIDISCLNTKHFWDHDGSKGLSAFSNDLTAYASGFVIWLFTFRWFLRLASAACAMGHSQQ